MDSISVALEEIQNKAVAITQLPREEDIRRRDHFASEICMIAENIQALREDGPVVRVMDLNGYKHPESFSCKAFRCKPVLPPDPPEEPCES